MEKQASYNEDLQLLSLMTMGNKAGFDALFRKYYKPLCNHAYRYVCFEDVEEIVQDVFIWIWENREQLSIRNSLYAYLTRAVHLRSITRIEQNKAMRRRDTHYWEQSSRQATLHADDEQTDELINRINEAIGRLPDKFREAFVMHRFRDCSYKEIAEQLNVSPKTVDYRIQQALKLLRNNLREHFPLLLLLYGIHGHALP